MAFDTQSVLNEYEAPSEKAIRDTRRLIEAKDFNNDAKYLALIGFGGTISSGYSYNKETILPGPYSPAKIVLSQLQDMFGLANPNFTAIDLCAKDSRDIENADLIDLLNFIDVIENKEILITCGTYMLPRIATLLAQSDIIKEKVIGLTGSMLPQGFMQSDAQGNVIGTISAMRMASRLKSSDTGVVLISFHGNIYSSVNEFMALDLHPESMKDIILVAPQTSMPITKERK